MVTDNVETDLDTNAARGKIIDIILHPDELPINRNNAFIKLKYIPSYLLIKLTRTSLKATKFEGLENCKIPIEPTLTTCRIELVMVGGDMVPSQRTVKRK